MQREISALPTTVGVGCGRGDSRRPEAVHFRKWRIDGRLRRSHDRLREAVRVAEWRETDPSAAVIDSRVVKTTPVGGPERGYDGAKRLARRKRHILVDTGGLILAAKVHAADLPDRDGGRRLLGDGKGLLRIGLLWADGPTRAGFASGWDAR